MATLWGGRKVIGEDGCGRRWWLMDYLVSNRMIGVMDRRWIGGAKQKLANFFGGHGVGKG
jgi:hypothetical protein